ncbi:MAG: hypothetical protein RL318_1899 [Fibrobacterota bacterium]|jgi:hypothetical protein
MSCSDLALRIYTENLTRYGAEKDRCAGRASFLANARLAVFGLACTALVFWIRSEQGFLWPSLTVAFLGIFVALVVAHARVLRRVDACGRFMEVNGNGLKRLGEDWRDFAQDGREFADRDHAFAADLDLFGKASLYQRICTARTFLGRRRLASLLAAEAVDLAATRRRQAAVVELSPEWELRQRVEVSGRQRDGATDPARMLDWAEGERDGSLPPAWLARGLPMVSLLSLFVELAVFHRLFVAALLFAVQIALFLGWWGRCPQRFEPLSRQGGALEAYQESLGAIETHPFSSLELRAVQGRLKTDAECASVSITRLCRIAERAQARLNPLGWIVLNCLWLWDLRCALDLQEWKRTSGTRVRGWLEALGEFEALASLSVLHFENETWCFPVLEEGMVGIEAKEMLHPLLPTGLAVANDIDLADGTVAILTGSNMSGKSTFLRCLGVNAVLAFAGAPVAAASLRLGRFEIHTSLRTSDDLCRGVSTFHAQIQRIRKMAEATREGRKVLFLVDEMFSGTNSQDRIAGARETLAVLRREGCLGLVSTHDLELCRLAQELDAFVNFHFEERYGATGIEFDYRLRKGPSTTRNAMHLLRLAGILAADRTGS